MDEKGKKLQILCFKGISNDLFKHKTHEKRNKNKEKGNWTKRACIENNHPNVQRQKCQQSSNEKVQKVNFSKWLQPFGTSNIHIGKDECLREH